MHDVFLAAVINEANLAFELNTGLFEAVEVLAKESKGTTPEMESEEEEVVFEPPLKLAFDSQTEKVYSLTSVVAFIAAGASFQV
jgi:hypothetical protein